MGTVCVLQQKTVLDVTAQSVALKTSLQLQDLHTPTGRPLRPPRLKRDGAGGGEGKGMLAPA